MAMYAQPTRENRKYTLQLRPVRPSGKGPGVLDESKTVHLYEVSGLPLGEQAWIADMNGSWQISHTKNGVLGDWTGNHRSPEDAWAVLQKQFEK